MTGYLLDGGVVMRREGTKIPVVKDTFDAGSAGTRLT